MNIKDPGISKITLGTVQLGLKYGMANKTGKPSLKTAHEMIDTALSGGINCFDTSHEYGDSEEVLGSYFSMPVNKQKDHVFVTKFKLDKLGDSEGGLVEKTAYDFASESMKKLGIDKIPVLMLHNSNDLVRFGDLVPNALSKLKKDGLIDHAGVSVYHVSEAEEMLRNDIYDAIQLPMNLFDQRFITSGMLDKMHKKDITVFVRSVFLQGMFFMDPDAIPENLMFASGYVRELREMSLDENVGIPEVAFSFIRDLEGVSSVVLGAETPLQVHENTKLINCPLLSPKIREKVGIMFGDVPIEKIMTEIRKVRYT
jgi:aryl-alcohol dehydrogenase-like predicted oxidoreductase